MVLDVILVEEVVLKIHEMRSQRAVKLGDQLESWNLNFELTLSSQ